jgi:hypothetical protein
MVTAKMAERKVSRYWLARRLVARKICGQRVVYRWLSGESDTTLTIAEAAMEELGILVVDVNAQWATVKTDNDIVVCTVGSPEWQLGSWRVIHGTREDAERGRAMRLGLPPAAFVKR